MFIRGGRIFQRSDLAGHSRLVVGDLRYAAVGARRYEGGHLGFFDLGDVKLFLRAGQQTGHLVGHHAGSLGGCEVCDQADILLGAAHLVPG